MISQDEKVKKEKIESSQDLLLRLELVNQCQRYPIPFILQCNKELSIQSSIYSPIQLYVYPAIHPSINQPIPTCIKHYVIASHYSSLAIPGEGRNSWHENKALRREKCLTLRQSLASNTGSHVSTQVMASRGPTYLKAGGLRFLNFFYTNNVFTEILIYVLTYKVIIQ